MMPASVTSTNGLTGTFASCGSRPVGATTVAAAIAFERWTGVPPSVDVMRAAVVAGLP